jgi:hypothetical protein
LRWTVRGTASPIVIEKRTPLSGATLSLRMVSRNCAWCSVDSAAGALSFDSACAASFGAVRSLGFGALRCEGCVPPPCPTVSDLAPVGLSGACAVGVGFTDSDLRSNQPGPAPNRGNERGVAIGPAILRLNMMSEVLSVQNRPRVVGKRPMTPSSKGTAKPTRWRARFGLHRRP